MIPSLSDEQLKTLALDIYAGRVFTDRHARPDQIAHVFLILSFLDEKQVEELRKEPPGLIYEYMHKAGSRSVNGMPMFLSFKVLNQTDTNKVFQIIEHLKKPANDFQFLRGSR